MPTAGVRVLTIAKRFDLPYNVTHIDKVANIMGTIAQVQPDVIVTSTFQPGALLQAPFEIRKHWIHVPEDAPVDAIIGAVEACYFHNCFHEHPNDKVNALISVYTGTYNPGDYLRECYESIRTQTYPNWEWVVVDDMSSDDTWDRLVGIAREDVRVRPFRSGKHIGKVGAVKGMATRLARGVYLVELDHDDMLADTALAEIKKVFDEDPEVGFVYSNCSAFFENGTFHQFPDPFWTPRYRWTEYHGKKWLECVSPNIYDRFGPGHFQQFAWHLTVNANHVRAFRATAFREVGGYNENLPVVDDWDAMAKIFLAGPPMELNR